MKQVIDRVDLAAKGQGPPLKRNSWFFKRDTEEACVIVTANWIARQSVWSMNCKINGELVDAYLADNPWDAAHAMIEHAILGTVDPAVTERIETDPVVTAAVTDDAPPVVA